MVRKELFTELPNDDRLTTSPANSVGWLKIDGTVWSVYRHEFEKK